MRYILFHNQLVEEARVSINVEDRGYNFGDGIYEVISVYNKQPFAMAEHFQRFVQSAEKLELTLPYSIDTFYSLTHELIKSNQVKDGLVYLQMTRGIASRNHLYERNMESIVTGFTKEWERPEKGKAHGVRALVTEDIRWLRCDIKTINLLGNVIAKRKAADTSCHEALLHRDKTVTEGSSSNIFIVNDGRLHTHPATNLILNGITRQIVLKLAKEKNIEVIEQPFTLTELLEADEVFMTSTGNEITPITSITGDTQANFQIGNVTRTIQADFDDLLAPFYQ